MSQLRQLIMAWPKKKLPISCPERELSSATIVPQDSVVGDITRHKDELHLIPGNAAGTAMPKGIPVCYWSTRQTGRLSK